MKKAKLFFGLIIGILILRLPLFAQFEGLKEVSFAYNDQFNDDYSILNLDNEAVLILNHKTNVYGRNSEIHFMRYDSTLNGVWKSDYSPGEDYRFVKYFKGEKDLYCLFREPDKKNIKILKINLERGDGLITEAKLLTDMEISFFVAIENKIVIGGKYNDRPVIEMCRLFDKTSKVLPNIHSNNISLVSIDVNEATSEFFIMLKDDKKCQFMMSIYDYDGKMIEMQELGEKKKILLSGQIVKLPNNKLILIGNFSPHCSDYSSGFYVYSLSGERKMQYFEFSDLQNFYAYLPKKRQDRIKSRINKRMLKGKDANIRYRLSLHSPIELNDEIVLLAEVYYPEYKSTPFAIRNNFQYLQNNTQVYKDFNNYKYTHALLVTLDFSGNKKWDYSVGLSNIESSVLNQKIHITTQGENYILAYPKDNFILTSMVGKNIDITQLHSFDLKTLQKSNNVQDLNVDLMAWYKNTYLAYGDKTVRSDNGLISKEYFFVQKLNFNNIINSEK